MLYETYIDGDLEFKGDVLVRATPYICTTVVGPGCCFGQLADSVTVAVAQDTLMNHRDEFVTYIFTFDLLKFLVYQFLGPLSSRSVSAKLDYASAP